MDPLLIMCGIIDTLLRKIVDFTCKGKDTKKTDIEIPSKGRIDDKTEWSVEDDWYSVTVNDCAS